MPGNIDERLSVLETKIDMNDKVNNSIWSTIENLKTMQKEDIKEIHKAMETICKDFCAKIIRCETKHEASIIEIKKETINLMTADLKAMKETIDGMGKMIDRIWSITWKALSLFAATLVTVAAWNIALATRISDTQKDLAKLQTTVERTSRSQNEVNDKLLTILSRMELNSTKSLLGDPK